MGTNTERISIPVVTSDTVTLRHRTRAGNKRIVAWQLVVADGASAAFGNKLRVLVDKNEVFPSNFDPSLLTFDQSTPPDNRWFIHECDIDESEIQIDYFDNGGGSAATLLIKCEY